jgi:putative redox protein
MPDVDVILEWSGSGMRFRGGREGGPAIELDGDGEAGPSPVTALVMAVGGCMAADIVDIGAKMRLPLQGLRIELQADRRGEPPRYLTAIRMNIIVEGVDASDSAKVQRAVDMSRDTYCSVLHSLRDDVAIEIALDLR